MSGSCDRKLKILCLHGYRQNADSFYNKLGAFRKLTKKYAELVIISAPLMVPPTPSLEAAGAVEPIEPVDQRGWWFTKELTFNAHDKTDFCYGFDQSLNIVRSTFDTQGPFDGLLGFSQGAAMVALLCGLQQSNELCDQFKFAILFAGFKSGSTVHDACFQSKITCPSLHVIGQEDKVIPMEMGIDLLQYFESPDTLFHPGGHFVPASGQQKANYIMFLEKMLSLC